MIIILSSLTAPRSSSVGPSVPVSPIFVLRTVVVFALAHQCNSSSGILLCADAQLCAELQVRLRSEREISDIQWWGGQRRTKGGGAVRKVQLFFTAATVNTHTERGRRRKTNGGVGRGRPLLLLSVTARAESARPLCVLQSSVTVLPLAMG